MKLEQFGVKKNLSRVLIFFALTGFLFPLWNLPLKAQTAKPVQVRTIKIISEPNATVWLDDIKFGKTDKTGLLTIKTVFAGKHTLRVRADGFKEVSKPIPANLQGDIKVPLTKTTDEAELAYQQAEKLTSVDRDKSAEAYRKAIKLRPKFPEAYLGLGRVLSEAGDLESAADAIKQARKLRPNYAEASAVEARILKDNGEEEAAIAAFKRAITEGKGFQPEAHTGLGLLYKERSEGFGAAGDFDEEKTNYDIAAQNFQKALRQLSGAPDSLVVYQLLGLIYERQKKYREAIAVYEEFLQLFPDSNEATAVRSYIVQIKKRMSEQ